MQLVGGGRTGQAGADHERGRRSPTARMRRRRRTGAVGRQHRSGAECAAGGDHSRRRESRATVSPTPPAVHPAAATELPGVLLYRPRDPLGGPHAAVAIPRHRLALTLPIPLRWAPHNIHSVSYRRAATFVTYLDGFSPSSPRVPGQRSGARQCGINHLAYERCESLSADRCRGRRGDQQLTWGTSGNISVRFDQHRFLISGFGRAPGGAHPRGHRLVFDRAGSLGGPRRPSVERPACIERCMRAAREHGCGAALLAFFTTLVASSAIPVDPYATTDSVYYVGEVGRADF